MQALTIQMKSVLLISLMVLIISGCAGSNSSSSKARKGGDDKALIHARLAEGYLKQKQYAVARDMLNKALRIDSNHSESNYIMALLLVELEQYNEAEKHFSKAVRANRQNSSAAHDFGTFLCQTGKERESVTYFEIATNNPYFDKSYLSYMRAGECLERIQDPKAEEYLKKALSLRPNLRPALFRLAMINYERGTFLSSRAYIERYFAITKPQPEALLLAYKIESELGAIEVANKYRKTLLEEFPGSRQASQVRTKLR